MSEAVFRYRWKLRGVWSEWTADPTPPSGATEGEQEVTTSDGLHAVTVFEFRAYSPDQPKQ